MIVKAHDNVRQCQNSTWVQILIWLSEVSEMANKKKTHSNFGTKDYGLSITHQFSIFPLEDFSSIKLMKMYIVVGIVF